MITFESKFNIGDTVFYINDSLEFGDALEIADLFETAISGIGQGDVNEIIFRKDNKPSYIIDGKPFSVDALFSSRKEAYLHSMNTTLKELNEAVSNIQDVIKNTSNNFDACYEEYCSQNN